MMPDVDYPGATPMWVDPDHTRNRIFYDCNPSYAIVIHKTAGFNDVHQLGDYFYNDPLVTCSHFGVDLDGEIAQFVKITDGAAANCCITDTATTSHDSFWDNAPTQNKNLCTISIEHIDFHKDVNGNYDNGGEVTPAQKAASFKLVKFLSDTLHIPASHIKTHKSLDPLNRPLCPNQYPMDELIAYVSSIPSLPPPPTQGEDDVNLTLKHITPNSAMQNQARTVWHANKQITVLENSGIFQVWAQTLYNGRGLGTPITAEYANNDWNGKPIVCQDFAGGHAEWDNTTSTCRLFVAGIGEMTFAS